MAGARLDPNHPCLPDVYRYGRRSHGSQRAAGARRAFPQRGRCLQVRKLPSRKCSEKRSPEGMKKSCAKLRASRAFSMYGRDIGVNRRCAFVACEYFGISPAPASGRSAFVDALGKVLNCPGLVRPLDSPRQSPCQKRHDACIVDEPFCLVRYHPTPPFRPVPCSPTSCRPPAVPRDASTGTPPPTDENEPIGKPIVKHNINTITVDLREGPTLRSTTRRPPSPSKGTPLTSAAGTPSPSGSTTTTTPQGVFRSRCAPGTVQAALLYRTKTTRACRNKTRTIRRISYIPAAVKLYRAEKRACRFSIVCTCASPSHHDSAHLSILWEFSCATDRALSDNDLGLLLAQGTL